MTQEEKNLLMIDLCSRLPYGVKVFYEYVDNINKKTYGYSLTLNTWCIDEMKAKKAVVKPYLFPLSSMTEEQEEEYNKLNCYELGCFPHLEEALDYLIENHFDYRGLIDKGLAIDATNKNIY